MKINWYKRFKRRRRFVVARDEYPVVVGMPDRHGLVSYKCERLVGCPMFIRVSRSFEYDIVHKHLKLAPRCRHCGYTMVKYNAIRKSMQDYDEFITLTCGCEVSCRNSRPYINYCRITLRFKKVRPNRHIHPYATYNKSDLVREAYWFRVQGHLL